MCDDDNKKSDSNFHDTDIVDQTKIKYSSSRFYDNRVATYKYGIPSNNKSQYNSFKRSCPSPDRSRNHNGIMRQYKSNSSKSYSKKYNADDKRWKKKPEKSRHEKYNYANRCNNDQTREKQEPPVKKTKIQGHGEEVEGEIFQDFSKKENFHGAVIVSGSESSPTNDKKAARIESKLSGGYTNPLQKEDSKWKCLPVLPQKIVLSLMNFPEKYSFASRSKKDKILALQTPTFMKYVFMKYMTSENEYGFDIDNETDTVTSVDDFLEYMEHPMSQICELTVMPEDSPMERTITKLENLSAKPLRVQEFYTIACEEIWDCVKRVLLLLDPKTLRTLNLAMLEGQVVLDEIVHTEQWKKGPFLEFDNRKSARHHSTRIDYNHFMHFPKFSIGVYSITADNLWKIIQNFRSRSFPHRAGFMIKTRRYGVRVEETILKFDVQPKHEPFDEDGGHVQRFEIKSNPNFRLVVLICETAACGVICRRDYVKEDFERTVNFEPADQELEVIEAIDAVEAIEENELNDVNLQENLID